jgi:hypothetical protein
LWKRLFEAADLPELHAERPPPEVIYPNAISMPIFHNGIEYPAELASGNVHVFAGCVPPEFVTASLRKHDPPPWYTFSGPVRRGIIAWGSHRRKERVKTKKILQVRPRKMDDLSENRARINLQEHVFIFESALKKALSSWKDKPASERRPGEAFVKSLVELVDSDIGLTIALVDDSCLSPAEMGLLRDKLCIIVGPLSDPTFRLEWPATDYSIHYWRSSPGSSGPFMTEQEAILFEGIATTLTHPRGTEGFLNRFSTLAYEAGLQAKCDWLDRDLD